MLCRHLKALRRLYGDVILKVISRPLDDALQPHFSAKIPENPRCPSMVAMNFMINGSFMLCRHVKVLTRLFGDAILGGMPRALGDLIAASRLWGTLNFFQRFLGVA